MDEVGGSARARLIAAYSLVCLNDTELKRFIDNLDEFSTQLIQATIEDLLHYLGLEGDIKIELVQLTKQQHEELEKTNKLDDYLFGKDEVDG